MDSLDLLAREDEFKKLNKQLERKTESLMKEIENVMQKPDIFSDFSHNLSLTPTPFVKKHFCTTPTRENVNVQTYTDEKRRKPLKTSKKNDNSKTVTAKYDEIDDTLTSTDADCVKKVVCDCCVATRETNRSDYDGFLQAFISVGVQDNILPKSFLKDKISVESVCKFLSSKLKLLQEQIDVLQTTIDKKGEQCKTHLTQHAELETERLSLLNKCNNLRASTADAKAKTASLEQRLAEKDRLYKEQRSECDRLICEVKRLRVETSNASAKNAAQDEQISTLTQRLKVAKAEHMEFRDATRALSASNQSAIDTLEARIKSLNSTVDKQTSLIDNLRKQNAILAAEGAVIALEKEYSNFLCQDL
ncbi:hypothetical protein evm_013676 [Chilo suppressalis]|nr:hypothetical protein evm_013676 [Chilo suppressalis]